MQKIDLRHCYPVGVPQGSTGYRMTMVEARAGFGTTDRTAENKDCWRTPEVHEDDSDLTF